MISTGIVPEQERSGEPSAVGAGPTCCSRVLCVSGSRRRAAGGRAAALRSEREPRAALPSSEVLLYNTKAVVHFLLPDFFHVVCVCNIV